MDLSALPRFNTISITNKSALFDLCSLSISKVEAMIPIFERFQFFEDYLLNLLVRVEMHSTLPITFGLRMQYAANFVRISKVFKDSFARHILEILPVFLLNMPIGIDLGLGTPLTVVPFFYRIQMAGSSKSNCSKLMFRKRNNYSPRVGLSNH